MNLVELNVFLIEPTMTYTQAAAPSSAQVTHIPPYKAATGSEGGLTRVKALQAFFKVVKIHLSNLLHNSI